MTTAAADCYDEIARARKRITTIGRICLTRECALWFGIGSTDCWCFRAGPNESHLPCPAKPSDWKAN